MGNYAVVIMTEKCHMSSTDFFVLYLDKSNLYWFQSSVAIFLVSPRSFSCELSMTISRSLCDNRHLFVFLYRSPNILFFVSTDMRKKIITRQSIGNIFLHLTQANKTTTTKKKKKKKKQWEKILKKKKKKKKKKKS